MDQERARTLLAAERARVNDLLTATLSQEADERDSENDTIAVSDAAEPLTAEGITDAVVVGLRQRLDALTRAEDRLAAGTYGRSVRSGKPIPDGRLEADPAAELTVEEADS